MSRIDINRIDRALVIKLRHIGDVLLTAPLIAALKAARPSAKIDALVPSGTEEMLTLNPAVDEVITTKRRGLIAGLRLIGRLREKRYDLVINTTEGDRGAVLAFATGARYRVGVDPKGKGFLCKRDIFTHLVDPVYDGRQKAVVDMDLLGPLGIEPGEPVIDIYTSHEDDEYVDRLLRDKGVGEGAPFAVVHPTSRWLFKCWRDEAVAEVIDYLEGRGIRVVVTSGPDDKEKARLAAILSNVKSIPIDLSGALTLKRLAALIRRSVLFFGVDTAPMHMAAAVGAPVVAIFGPSDHRTWAPLGSNTRVVTKTGEFDCIPCRRDGCDGTKRSACLEAVTPGEAIGAIEQILQ